MENTAPASAQNLSKSYDLEDFLQLVEDASPALLDVIRAATAPPEGRKVLRTWSTSDAAKMVGCSKGTLLTRTKEAAAQKARGETATWPLISQDDRGHWRFTLDDINKIRASVGTLPRRPAGAPACIVASENFKGGAAKTTTTIHLAQALALRGWRVLVVDTDPQGSATTSLGYYDSKRDLNDTAGPVIMGTSDDLSEVVVNTHWPNIDLIPSCLDFAEVETFLITKIAREEEFRDIFWAMLSNPLRTLANANYDIVFIDTPPALGMLAMNVVFATDVLVVPCPPKAYDVESTMKFVVKSFEWVLGISEAFSIDRKELPSVIRLLPTLVDRRSMNTDLTILELMRADLYPAMFRHNFYMSDVIKSGGGAGLTVLEADPRESTFTRETTKRAVQIVDEVCDELQVLITGWWSEHGS